METASRITKLAETLQTCDALIIDDPTDLFYLLGIDLSLGRLVVFKHSAPILLVDGRYELICRQQAPAEVILWDFKGQMPIPIQGKVGFDSTTTSYHAYLSLKQDTRLLLKAMPSPLSAIRCLKEKEELKKIKQASDLCVRGLDHILKLIQEGVSEKQLAQALKIFWLNEGADDMAFEPIIAFGENSAKPHHRASDKKLLKGETILIDIGVKVHHYNSDMTRVYFYKSVSAKMEKIYRVVYEALDKALKKCKPGVRIGDIDQEARSYILSQGYAFVHGLGHGVGLQVHEAPRVKNQTADGDLILEPHMVITIEPGVYVEGVGGVRLEELIVINDKGYEKLIVCPTPQMPKIIC
jgi:Xaa-Pro aminopeptidase